MSASGGANQGRRDDERGPIDAALDVLFYAPLGLALSAAEEVPKFAAKGRKRFTRDWNNARVIGQFAVQQGRQQAKDRFGPQPAPAKPAAAPPPEPAPAPAAAPEPAAGPVVAEPVAAEPLVAPEPAAPVPGVDELAIPGYDSLSASQVVQRLAGLAPDELDAVRAYEAGTRGRRTILTRVAQLQGS